MTTAATQKLFTPVRLNGYDHNTFNTFDAHGYTDYPFYANDER